MERENKKDIQKKAWYTFFIKQKKYIRRQQNSFQYIEYIGKYFNSEKHVALLQTIHKMFSMKR